MMVKHQVGGIFLQELIVTWDTRKSLWNTQDALHIVGSWFFCDSMQNISLAAATVVFLCHKSRFCWC